MELTEEEKASCRRFLNSKAGKSMYALLESKRPRAAKTDFTDMYAMAFIAASIKGYEDVLDDLKTIRDNNK